MTTQEQTNIVKNALELSILISETAKKLNGCHNETFRNRPQPPKHEIITATYPKIESTVKFWSPILLLTLFFLPFPIIYYYYIYKPNKEKNMEKIRKSEEYRRKCANIDEDVKQRQKTADDTFEKAIKEYNEVIIPPWEKEKAEWETDLTHRIDNAQLTLTKAKNELEELYYSTKIIPLQYRNIDALRYVYDTMSTSDYDIQGAIELYDKHRQRILDEERLYEQKTANSLSDEQNDLLARQNDIAVRARRQAALSNTVSAVQRHNTNKMLKNQFGKKK